MMSDDWQKYGYIRLFLVVPLVLGLIWFLAETKYESMIFQRAAHDLSLIQRNESPHQWHMNNLPSVLLDSHALDNKRIVDGELRFVSGSPEAAFNLNLKGRLIDKSYRFLSIRMFSSGTSKLGLFHTTTENRDYTLSSDLFPVSEGWQTIKLDLDKISWSPIYIGTMPGREDIPQPTWGGATGVISKLRIDPVNSGETGVRIDWIKLDPVSSFAAGDDIPHYKIDYFDSSFDSLLEVLGSSRHKVLVVSQQSSWRTPEFNYWMRQQIHELAPAAQVIAGDVELDGLVEPRKDAEWSLPSVAEILIPVFMLIMLGLIISTRAELAPKEKFCCCGEVAIFILIFLSSWIGIQWHIGPEALWYGVVIIYCGILLLRRKKPQTYWRALFGLTAPAMNGWSRTIWVTIAMGSLVLIAAYVANTLSEFVPGRFVRTFPGYLLSATVQQIVLGPVIAGFLLGTLAAKDRSSNFRYQAVILFSGFIFALLHYPNFALMNATFVLGCCWVFLFLKYRSILPLILSQALLGTLIRELAPPIILLEGDVGRAYFEWLIAAG